MFKIFFILISLGCVMSINFCFASINNQIPLEDFFKNPETIDVKLSPDGKYISYGKPWKSRINIFVKNLETNEIKQLTFSTERDILHYIWTDNDTIVYLQDNDGDENFHVYSTFLKGGDVLDLTPFGDITCSLVDELENDGTILFQMNKQNKQIFDLYRLDTKSGKMELVAENPGDVTEWITDNAGKLRVARFTDGVNSGIRYRKDEKSDWKTIATYNFKEAATPLFFTFDNKQIYVSSNIGRDKKAIFEYDLESGKETKCIFEHPNMDVNALIKSKKRKEILGVYYLTDKIEYKIFDKEFEKIYNFINEKLSNYENHFVSHDKNESKFIIYSTSDKTLGSYYLFNAVKWELKKIFDVSPWLKESEMASMKPISYTSKDGLIIHGYLTLPNGKKTNNLPLIVIPHGGPWERDVWEFKHLNQFLANRGYAILRMNFRGSTGYGRKFLEAGYKQWGLKMQDDITDGVQWAIDQGIADPKRIGILGGSYGGYAVLSGITKTPDLYAAAVDYVGISNIFTFFDTLPPYWEPFREMCYEMIGHPINDKEQLIATSPIFNVDKIKTPLFIAQGANDPRAKKEHSDQMVEALKKRGVVVEYMVKNNEGHGFMNEENNFDFYRAMETFLQKHIGKETINNDK
ncbi:MAG: Dipeptidyl aminopeptidase BIII [Candidatus Anoxychlamydiales bacterium]|nr:Dipeptidyl aminopeptidase BIII [Candidatus Anoxychlamydiales bacterium]